MGLQYCCRSLQARALGTLSHLSKGSDVSNCILPAMVNVGAKLHSDRSAHVVCTLSLPSCGTASLDAAAFSAIAATAVTAGTLAAKRTDELIPMCHTLPLDSVQIDIGAPFARQHNPSETIIRVSARTFTSAKTGVEMEAFVAATTAALTLLDMLKSSCPPGSIVLRETRLLEKRGGKSDFQVEEIRVA